MRWMLDGSAEVDRRPGCEPTRIDAVGEQPGAKWSEGMTAAVEIRNQDRRRYAQNWEGSGLALGPSNL
jgi:hypothetical protein